MSHHIIFLGKFKASTIIYHVQWVQMQMSLVAIWCTTVYNNTLKKFCTCCQMNQTFEKYSLFNLLSPLWWIVSIIYVIALAPALARGPIAIIEANCTEEMHWKWFQLNSIAFKWIQQFLKFSIDAPEWCHWSQRAALIPINLNFIACRDISMKPA